MSRPLGIEYPGAWYHVMNRGRRSEIIFSDKSVLTWVYSRFDPFLVDLTPFRATSHIRGTLYAIGDTKYELKDNAV